ncbi:MAG: trigger factor [Actinomycetota bacterium]|nr:trigger factor [Actinomycetota bacterium]
MSYSIKSQEKLEKNKVKLKVEVSDGYFKKSLGKAYKDISEKAKIPGFRKGRIPYEIIDINYGKEYVLSEAANISISELYPEIIESSDIKPIDYPKVDIDGEIVENKPINFLITVDVEPEAEVAEYKGIKADGLPTDVEEEEINSQIENLRNRFASLEPIDENDVSKKNDIATIDFKGTIDGKEFEGGSYNDYVLDIGAGMLYKEIEEALVGLKKGEETNVSVKMPKEIENKEIAGKKAEFNLKMKEIKRKILPEVDEEFLKNMGDFENAEALKEFIKNNLKEQKENARQNKIFSDIVKYLVDNSKIDIPKIMIDNEIKELKHDFEHKLEDQKITKEQYLSYFNITEDKFEKDFEQRALNNVKEYIIFNTLENNLKKEIEPDAKEIEEEKERIIKNTAKAEDKKKLEDYFKTAIGEKNVKSSVRRKKLVDILIDNAKINEISAEELKKASEQKNEDNAEKAKKSKIDSTKKAAKTSKKSQEDEADKTSDK